PPGAAFLEALSIHVERFMDTGLAPYPVERTLLTGGILDWVLESRGQKKRLETSDLDVSYDPPKDSGFMRGAYEGPGGGGERGWTNSPGRDCRAFRSHLCCEAAGGRLCGAERERRAPRVT